MKVELGLGVVVVCAFAASSAQMREERRPSHDAPAIGDNASSQGRAATGARSAKPNNVKCGLPASAIAVIFFRAGETKREGLVGPQGFEPRTKGL
jgi:hypothetical protein